MSSIELKFSLRLPPTLDSNKAIEDVRELLTKNVPYGAHVIIFSFRLNLRMLDMQMDGMHQLMNLICKNLLKILLKSTSTMNGWLLVKEEESLLWESSLNFSQKDNSSSQEFWVLTQMLMDQMNSCI